MTPTAVDDTVVDEEWLAAPVRRSRARLVLAGLLASSLFFLGGVLTQKHLGASEEAATGPTAPAGFDPGDLPAGAGFPAGAGDTPDTGDQADGSDAVIGTVVRVRGDTWVVEDLGGKRHEVRVTGGSDIVRETRLGADRVAVGDSVDITGTTADGRLSAEQVTLR